MVPFDSYPGGGRALLGLAKGSSSRREYGPQFMRLTSERLCAYCSCDFTKSYETWLTMALDHVVPASVCLSKNIPHEWCEDFSNTVLACAACNTFCNRYVVIDEIVQPVTLEAFFDLRDRVFAERKHLILERHKAERLFFGEQPWEGRSNQPFHSVIGK